MKLYSPLFRHISGNRLMVLNADLLTSSIEDAVFRAGNAVYLGMEAIYATNPNHAWKQLSFNNEVVEMDAKPEDAAQPRLNCEEHSLRCCELGPLRCVIVDTGSTLKVVTV